MLPVTFASSEKHGSFGLLLTWGLAVHTDSSHLGWLSKDVLKKANSGHNLAAVMCFLFCVCFKAFCFPPLLPSVFATPRHRLPRRTGDMGGLRDPPELLHALSPARSKLQSSPDSSPILGRKMHSVARVTGAGVTNDGVGHHCQAIVDLMRFEHGCNTVSEVVRELTPRQVHVIPAGTRPVSR